jgi:hypothetical protein
LDKLYFQIIGLEVFAEAVLQDVIPEVALNNLVEIDGVRKLPEDLRLHSQRCLVDADLNELGRVLVLAQLYEVPENLGKDLAAELVRELVQDL